MLKYILNLLRSCPANSEENWRGYTLFLFVLTLLTRLPFRSHLLYDHDSVQFALGLRDYDVYLHQPHPPGYFLYVHAAKLLNFFIGDANSSFVWISMIASACAVVIAGRYGRSDVNAS